MTSPSNNKKGLTLIESLISIVLLSVIAVSILGSFYIARLSAERAEHRLSAMNILREYIEQEIKAGYDGGAEGESDYYATVTSGDPVTREEGGVTYSITPDPYYPDNIEGLVYGSVPYKIIGFVVTWGEGILGQTSSERAVCYVAYHPT